MSKITRQTLLQFGATVNPASEIGEFGSGATGSPTYTATISLIQSLAAWSRGWAAETIANNRPFLEDMNAVDYVFGYQLCYLFEMGIPEYDAATTYYTNSFVQYSGVLYQSLSDANVGNTPTPGANWKLAIPPISGIIGVPVSKTPGTLYQAATDGFVIGAGSFGGGAEVGLNIGSTSGLGTQIAQAQSAAVGGQTVYDTLCTLVPKNWYWETGGAGGGSLGLSLYFIPIGT